MKIADIKKIKIKEEAIKFIGRINEKNPYYLVIGVLVVVLLLDYFLIMRFQLNTLRALGPKRSEIADGFKQFETNRSRVEKYKKDIELLDERLIVLEKRIRTIEEVPVVLEELSRVANRHKIFVEQIIPDANFDQPVLKNADGRYYLMPVVIEAKSGYHHFGRFLNALEEEGALMKVKQIMMVANVANPRQHQIKLEVQAVIFEPASSTRKVAVSQPPQTGKKKK